jgi:hypothetical protein
MKKIKTGYVIKMRKNLFFGSASHRERVLPISSYTTTTHTMCRSCCCCSEFFINSSSFTSTPQCSHFPPSPSKKNFSFHTVFFFFLVCSLDEKQPPIADESVFIPDAPQYNFPGTNVVSFEREK